MTGEDTYVKATQFRRPDETLAGIVGSVHKDPMRIADDRTPELRRGGQNTKRDKGTTRIVPRIVVAEQWLCFLLGLICTICGICGLFMKYNHDLTPFAHLRWMGPAHGAILRSSAIACFVVGAVLVRCGLASPDQSLLSIGQEALVVGALAPTVPPSPRLYFLLEADYWLRIEVEGKRKDHHERRRL
jgi:hypothetical protein